MQESLVLAAIHRAINARQPSANLIHHTDRGGQYLGTQYRAVLARTQLQQSMNRRDNCYDNAFQESCFGTIKTELEGAAFKDERVARKELPEYIRYYDHDRRHSSLGYLTPVQFEIQAAEGMLNKKLVPGSRTPTRSCVRSDFRRSFSESPREKVEHLILQE